MPDISIISPSLNSAAVITDCIRSVAEQTHVAEHLVIDDDGRIGADSSLASIEDGKKLYEAAVTDMLSGNAFGEAGCRVVIEEFLPGEEASFIVMVDGSNVLPMATSQDHKRIGEGDTGPNTGGMGAYSPAPVVDPAVYERIMTEVILPTVRGMAAEGNEYTGFLYAGLMISPAGEPKVIEYNCRFGDPETQPIMVRLQSDLVELCDSALNGELEKAHADWDPRCAMPRTISAHARPRRSCCWYSPTESRPISMSTTTAC